MHLLKRDLRRDEEGVASTVGTIMALLVFLTFMSLMVNQYVPVWQKDTEASHMNGALGQFGHLKQAIDMQILTARIAQDSGTAYIPITSSSPVTLGVDGVPIFGNPTPGELKADPNAAPWSIEFEYVKTGVLYRVEETASGIIELNVANRYFLAQRLAYEVGAVLRYQIDGQVLRALPVFEPILVENSIDLSFQVVSLYGSGAVAGTSTEIVHTKLFGLDRQDYDGIASSIWINHTTRYGLAWYSFLNSTLARTLGVTSGAYTRVGNPTTTLLIEFIGRVGGLDAYRVRATFDPATDTYLMALEVYEMAYPIRTFRLLHAYVQVGIGEATEGLQN